MAYLEDAAFLEGFCEGCEAVRTYWGTFNPNTGFGEPPYSECPADFDQFSRDCVRHHRIVEIIDYLRDADNIWR